MGQNFDLVGAKWLLFEPTLKTILIYLKSVVNCPLPLQKKKKENEAGGTIDHRFGAHGAGKFFFDPPKKIKPSVQKVPLYAIHGDI